MSIQQLFNWWNSSIYSISSAGKPQTESLRSYLITKQIVMKIAPCNIQQIYPDILKSVAAING